MASHSLPQGRILRSTAVRSVIATVATVTTALTLAGCADSGTDLDHGKVIDKRDKVNEIIAAAKADGSLNAISQAWLKLDLPAEM